MDVMEPLSRNLLIEKGVCCGRGCQNCPYDPEHEKGSVDLAKWTPPTREEWEKVFGPGGEPIPMLPNTLSEDSCRFIKNLKRIYKATRESNLRFDG